MQINDKKRLAIIVGILIVIGIVFIFSALKEKVSIIFFPIVIGIIITYLLNPMIDKLQNIGLKRSYSILLVMLVFFMLVLLFLYFTLPILVTNITEITESIPEIVKQGQSLFSRIMNLFDRMGYPTAIKNIIIEKVEEGVSILETNSRGYMESFFIWIGNFIGIIAGVVLAIVLSYYFLRDKNQISDAFILSIPRNKRNAALLIFEDLNKVLRKFIQGQMTIALIVAILETLALLLFGVKYALFLGIIGGIVNIIPYFGPFIAAIPAVIISFLQSPWKAFWVIIAYIIIQQIDNMVISPRIIEGNLGLHPVVTIIAVVIGGELGGLLGMILAVPITAIIKIILIRSFEYLVE